MNEKKTQQLFHEWPHTRFLSVSSMSLSWKIRRHSFLQTRTNWATVRNLTDGDTRERKGGSGLSQAKDR